ncbi:salivary peroxidase/catechol oxidase-like [Epargyreus clarus]|uniref:salivary peroxidase/catechol oxidase-like n=1 Tax=Epargyreus clarus TaxID=520877 RepID=UPI003C2B0F7D
MGFVWMLVCAAVLACVCTQEVHGYDAYFGKPLSENRSNFLATIDNGTFLCTVPVRACRKDEGRRVDGTCTNPKYPSRGATLTPLPRLLPARYGSGNTLRPAKDGSPLPSTRHLRTTLMGDGHFRDKEVSSLATDVFVFSFVDNVDLFYLLRYAVLSDCCINNQVPNLADPRCIPIEVQQDDPFLRRTGIRCMNLTRVETYQDYGCLPNTLPAERYNRVTPLLDLSTVYGNTEARSREIRANSGGLLAFRMEGDREVPAGQSPFCLRNQPQNLEIACYDYGDNYDGNLLMGTYLTAMWFFREHNRLARALAAINPCWDDQQLYDTARKINIAQWQYIFYYELIPEMIGYKNALDSGVIYNTKGHVNDFDPKCEPGVYHEYVIGCRWFHTFQSGVADLYRNGTYIGSRTVIDDTFRSGILALNNTEADLTFRDIFQPSDKFDYVLDPDLGNRIHGEGQAASDIGAIDMMRGRDAGLPPYNEYRKLCGMKPAKTFEDFHDTIDKDKVVFLSRLYEDVDDVDLMTAIYVERMIPGGYVGPTLYCIITHNLLLWRRSDKFFFEHGGFPAALSEHQLMEIKNTRIARILCDNGVGVTRVQPFAFLKLSPWNNFVSCDAIPGINLMAWQDHMCMEEDKHKKKK